MGLESATYVDDLVATNPVGATDQKKQGDDHLRLIKSVLKATFPNADHAIYLDQAQADVASATTTDIGAATTNFVRVTGTTTITGLGTVAAGVWRMVRFAGALTLTHSGTALILPSAANITTAANDRALFISLGSGNWFCLFYQRASGAAVVGSANPSSDDGEALGTTSLKWSDLFLASGAVINFNSGNITITHAAGKVTLGGSGTFEFAIADGVLSRAELKDYAETVEALGSVSGSVNLDFEAGNVKTVTIGGVTTFAFTNPPASGKAGSMTLIITNGGSATVNWPASVDWDEDGAPTLTAAGRDVVSFMTVDGGTIVYGFKGGVNFS